MLTKTPNDIKNFVLLTEPGGEKRAHGYLRNEGFDPYVPMESKIVSFSVRTMFGIHRRSREETRAIFPGYLFLPIDMGWNHGDGWETPLDRCPGLRRQGKFLLKANKRHRYLTEDEMDKLRLAECICNNKSPFEIGDQVRILDGPFADHIAEISRMDDLQRIELLKDFLGRKTKTLVTISQIAAV